MQTQDHPRLRDQKIKLKNLVLGGVIYVFRSYSRQGRKKMTLENFMNGSKLAISAIQNC